MERPNSWLTQTEQEKLAYMYQQDGGMEVQQLDDHQEQYSYTPPMATPSFHPSRASNFPIFGGSSSLPNLPFLGSATTEENELGQPSSFLSFGAGHASTLNFSGGSLQLQKGAMQLQTAIERRTRSPGNAQDHVIAERKRREKLQQQFVSLTTIVPGIKKTDKISLLGSTIDYVKQLEEKVMTLKEPGARWSAVSDSNAVGHSGSEYSSPVVETSIRGNTALLTIACTESRGVLVMVLSELENRGLSVIHANVEPFTDYRLNITITAKMEKRSLSAVELVENLTMALISFNSNKNGSGAC